MDQHGVANFRHRQSPSSDRFLGVFSPSKSDFSLSAVEDNHAAGDELNEYDVFWTGDFTERQRRSSSQSSQTSLRKSIHQPEKFGILAALSEDRRNSTGPLYRTASFSPPSSTKSTKKTLNSALSSPMIPFSRAIPALPKPQSSSLSVPARKFQQSAPVKVPMYKKKPLKSDPDVEGDKVDDDEMLPPHEIVARSTAARSSFSVLEGVGRTLKGRDLRQVRNAVWRQTGFLD